MTSETSPNLHDAFDIAITLGYEEATGFEATLLFDEEIFPICTPEFMDQHPHFPTLDNLQQEPLLELNRDHWKYKKWSPMGWDRWFQESGISEQPRNTVMSFNHFPLLLNAVKSNMGIGLAWAHLTEFEIQNGSLIRPIKNSYRAVDRKHYLVIRKELKDAPEVVLFKKWIIQQTATLRHDL